MPDVCVIGHRGFIGQSILRIATEQALPIAPMDIPQVRTSDAADSRSFEVEQPTDWAKGNAQAFHTLVEGFSSFSTVINAAGRAEPDSTKWTDLAAGNSLLPGVVALAAREARVERLVHISSAAVLGSTPIFHDESPAKPVTLYGVSKATGEAMALAACRPGFEVVIYRPTSVVAPDRKTIKRLARLARHYLPTASIDAPLPLCHIDNVASAAIWLSTNSITTRYVAHPHEGVTVGDLIEWAGGKPIILPNALAETISWIVGANWMPSGLQGVARRVDLLVRGQSSEARILQESGYRPSRSKEAIERIFRDA